MTWNDHPLSGNFPASGSNNTGVNLGSKSFWAEVAVGAGLGAVAGSVVPVIGTVGGAIAGGLVAVIVQMWGGSGGNQATAQGQRTYYAEELLNNTAYGLAAAHTNAHNVNAAIPDTTIYMARNAEWAAAQLYEYQTAHSLSHLYNASYVLAHSVVTNDTLADLWQTMFNYNSVFEQYTTISSQFAGTFANMNWDIELAAASGGTLRATSGQYMRMQLTEEITPTSSAQWVEIAANATMYVISPTQNGAVHLKLVSSATGATTWYNSTMKPSQIDAITLGGLGLPSGRYCLESSNDIMVCGIFGNDPFGSGTSSPAILVTSFVSSGNSENFTGIDYYNVGGSTWGFRTVTNSGTGGANTLIVNDGSTDHTLAIGTNMANDMISAASECRNLTSIANSYAQTYYNQLVAANGNLATPWSDIIFPSTAQLENMNSQELTALYYSYLLMERSWFNTSTILTPANVNITPNSAYLLVRGSIWNAAGKELVWNTTVWTPYFMMNTTTIKLGWNNVTQMGFAETWYDATTIQSTTRTTNFSYINLVPGMRMHIDQIYVNGTATVNDTLAVKTWDFIITQNQTTLRPPQVQTDLQWLLDHWYYIAALAGIVFLAAAIAVRNTTVAIIGLILLAAALVGWYMAGDFSLLSFIKLQIQSAGQWVIWRR